MSTLNQEVNSMLTKKNRPSYHKERMQIQRQRFLAIERPDLKGLTRKERRALQHRPFSINRMTWKYATWCAASLGSIDGEIRDMFVNDQMNLDTWSSVRIDELNRNANELYEAVDAATEDGNSEVANSLHAEYVKVCNTEHAVSDACMYHLDAWMDAGFFIGSPVCGRGIDRFESDLMHRSGFEGVFTPSYYGLWELADGISCYDDSDVLKMILGDIPLTVLMGE